MFPVQETVERWDRLLRRTNGDHALQVSGRVLEGPPPREIAVDGILGGETVGAISQFQDAVFRTSDGAVDIGHFTMRTLAEDHFRSLDDQIADSDISQFNEHNIDTLAAYPQLETEVLAELTATAAAYLRHLHERA
jgi:hypothetical protein